MTSILWLRLNPCTYLIGGTRECQKPQTSNNIHAFPLPGKSLFVPVAGNQCFCGQQQGCAGAWLYVSSPAWLSTLSKALTAAVAPGLGERRRQGQATAEDRAQK